MGLQNVFVLLLVVVVWISEIIGSETNMEIDCAHRKLEGKSVWNCSGTGIFDFPESHIPTNIQVMDFSNNHLVHIPVILQEHTNNCSADGFLRNLYLHHNQIESIEDDTFQDLYCLEALDLSFNHIAGDTITAKTLQGLYNIKSLNLRGNPLVILRDFALDYIYLHNLAYVDLSQCKLESIEPNALDHIAYLQTLNLSGNSLTELDVESFRGLNFLKELDLSHNKLTHINNQTLYPLLALELLILDSNNIIELQIEAFEGLDRLVYLSLRNNRLVELPYETFRPLKRYLKELDLSGNLFISLREHETDFVTKVELLKLDEMPRLRSVGPHSTKLFPYLHFLYMRKNPSLHSITEHAFMDSFDFLQYVYISDNKLSTIKKDTLPWSNLRHLDWSGNPWNCDCYLKWLVTYHAVNQSLVCFAPTKFEGRDLMELHPLDLKCPRSMMPILVGFLVSIVCVIVGVTVFVMWKYRKHRSKCCLPKRGKYVSVYTNNGADHDEARATILPSADSPEILEEQV